MYHFNSYMADRYFAEEMQKKIFLLNRRSGGTVNFWQRRTDPSGEYHYFLSTIALLGLKDVDRRLSGVVDTMQREGHRSERGRKHSWVEFVYQDKLYVYDPLVENVILRDIWYDLCNPRDIASDLTQRELLKSFFIDKFAYKITNEAWQFKPISDAPKDLSEEDECIFKALQNGHLAGRFEIERYTINTFIADEPRICY